MLSSTIPVTIRQTTGLTRLRYVRLLPVRRLLYLSFPIEFVDKNDAASWTLINNSNYLIDGKYLLGGTQLNMTNPFAAMYASGYQKLLSRRFQFDAGINLDLYKVLKGLSFRTQFSVDYGTSYITSIDDDYAVYEASWNNAFGGDRITSLTKYNMDKHTGTQKRIGQYGVSDHLFLCTVRLSEHFCRQSSCECIVVGSRQPADLFGYLPSH